MAVMRPTFELTLDLSPEDVIGRVRRGLEVEGTPRCMSKGWCAELYVPEEERKIWSPYLSVQAEGCPDREGTVLRGRFSPSPETWTLVMFVYGVAWFMVVFGGTLGYVQSASDEAAWGMWGVWVGLAVVVAVHIGSATGQRLGSGQMQELERRLVESLGREGSPSVR